METSKENVFKVEYASVLGGNIIKKKKWTSKFAELFNKNKLVTATIIIFAMCVILNFVLIYNFMRILENM